uniref:ATP synthase F0 subunit 8 n=1 Tax=Membranipora grandicella TaxID=192923 RepID=I6M190_9BILA|nr:ATP synthase F0 subunit 8 [Membranipora grandicella]AEH99599.1 ATP synthase F0 subunit 8 [Membranipora grandicella]
MPHMSPMLWKSIFLLTFLSFFILTLNWEFMYPSIKN